MAESSKYTYDEWVGQVRPDPRNTDPLTLLQGYIGPSSESGHIRVYSDETLNSFVEVPGRYCLRTTVESSRILIGRQ